MSNPKTVPISNQSSMVPEILDQKHRFKFSCHPEISCFNACCKQADVMLAPYDVIRLKQFLAIGSEQFLKQYTVPWEMTSDGVIGVKLKTSSTQHCIFLSEQGCRVYQHRPAACRYYPFGLMAMKSATASGDIQNYFCIQEDYCKGFVELSTNIQEISLAEYRHQQEIIAYDLLNIDWIRIMLKKQSAGPAVGKPSPKSLQFLFMATFDMDRFKRFLNSDSFRLVYDISNQEFKLINRDDVVRLEFGYRLLFQILFGENSIGLKKENIKQRTQQRKKIWQARHKLERESVRQNFPNFKNKEKG